MMIPITRKEKYINEIVGGGDTAPETPQTREELFFAEILGEVIAPSPVTRVEKYYAKIANKYSGELSEPVTRIERFIARAAGMDVTIPTPITREEMLWANYALIVEKELSGIPPLTFKAKKAGTLKDYRIYGNTAGGESVGDKTGNLFDKSGSQYGNNLHWGSTFSLLYSDTYYGSPIMDVTGLNTITRSYTGTGANYFSTSDLSQFVNVSNIGTVDAGVTVNVPDGYTKYVFNIPNTISPDSIMVNAGSTALPYEPYGYRVPVTVEGKNLFDKTNFIQTNLVSYDDENYILRGDPHTISMILPCNPNTKYTILKIVTNRFVIWGCTDYPTINEYCNRRIISGNNSSSLTFTTGNNDNYLLIMLFYQRQPTDPTIEDVKGSLMFNYGEALPYEPYHTPVTVPIYLPEQIRKVGDEAEYIDYGEQKFHRISGADLDVTLPALPTVTGTNVLSVGTEVQPSDVYIKYEGAR